MARLIADLLPIDCWLIHKSPMPECAE